MGLKTWVHKSNVRNLCVQLSLTQLAKMHCLPCYACIFSSTKLEIRAEQVLPGSEGVREERVREKGQGREMPKQCMCMRINE
jgi:hypothetical protein